MTSIGFGKFGFLVSKTRIERKISFLQVENQTQQIQLENQPKSAGLVQFGQFIILNWFSYIPLALCSGQLFITNLQT